MLPTFHLTKDSNFFPEKAFDKQLYETTEKIQPYEDYAAGKRPQTSTSKPCTMIQVLRRKRSRRVDMFLDWLVR